ncbi:sensory rhodopsin transducer [Methylomicrobium agile]|uniref:sensory rhodopsin transducer n=1 Tax=Methylomicrobium agile TaxID=39774 RepID=UPI0004DF460E|nr:sensory rhodopsin transducer [Methylomicrobium agile]
MNIGHKRWIVADGYIPAGSTGRGRELVSHDALCILNCGHRDARIEIKLYFSDRKPAGPYRFTVEAERTRHLRFNDFADPEPVPHNTDYASVIEAGAPVIVQHTRLDSRQPALALMTTIAYPA